MQCGSALWYTGGGTVEIRDVAVAPRDGDVGVRALYSGISRGTERLVSRGRVPASEYARMRCPHQDGAFPFPVKYGYALVGRVESGPGELMGRTVFVLHPHQSVIAVPASDAHVVPVDVPPRRAALAANMETALTVLWDGEVGPGDRVLVVGGGVVGLLIAGLAARIPGSEVTVADINPARAAVANALGARFALPEAAPGDQDVVIHSSATPAGLSLALTCAGTEAKVVEASWYGDQPVPLALGEAFHARRLSIISSQVGLVPAARRGRWSSARRLATALALLRDPAFDSLITGELPLADAPLRMAACMDDPTALMTVLRYS